MVNAAEEEPISADSFSLLISRSQTMKVAREQAIITRQRRAGDAGAGLTRLDTIADVSVRAGDTVSNR